MLHYRTGGGVVVNKRAEFLVLERQVQRDGQSVHEIRLPKGHIDEGETVEVCALREVGEESGYWNLKINAFLGVTRSVFKRYQKEINRIEYYYLMTFINSDETCGEARPVDEEEALFIPCWLAPEEACTALTFPGEQEIALRAYLFLQAGKKVFP